MNTRDIGKQVVEIRLVVKELTMTISKMEEIFWMMEEILTEHGEIENNLADKLVLVRGCYSELLGVIRVKFEGVASVLDKWVKNSELVQESVSSDIQGIVEDMRKE